MNQETATKPFITDPGKQTLPVVARCNHKRHPSQTTILLLLLCGYLPFTASAVEKIYYYHNDHLGSPVAMSDEGGTVVWRADYQPFGETATSGSIANTHGYIGKERDPETGLYYVGARYYDPNTGRFLSRDPALTLGDGGDLNLGNPETLAHYPYSKNNPYRYKDSNGQWFAAVAAGAAALRAYFEVGSTLYDAGKWVETQFDPNATDWDKDMAGLAVVAGLGLPGPGSAYDDVGKRIIGYVPTDDVLKYTELKLYFDEGINLNMWDDLVSDIRASPLVRSAGDTSPPIFYTDRIKAQADLDINHRGYQWLTGKEFKNPGLLRADIPVEGFNDLIRPFNVGPGMYELCTGAACDIFNRYMK